MNPNTYEGTKPKKRSWGIALVIVALIGTLLFVILVSTKSPAEPASTSSVEAIFMSAEGKGVGKATLSDEGKGVSLRVQLKGMTPGLHAIHFHENSRCEAPDFKSAGAHLNPGKKMHGLKNPKGPHAGDLPNLEVQSDGTAEWTYSSKEISFKKGIDVSLVIHAGPDDGMTDPAGNSGDRVACAVVRSGAAATKK